jgi:hypothetical protein
MSKCLFIRTKSVRLSLILLLVFNLFDAISTHLMVGGGFATEVNPICQLFLSQSILAFYLFKMSVGIPVFWVYTAAKTDDNVPIPGRVMVYMVTLGYLALVIYETIFMTKIYLINS